MPKIIEILRLKYDSKLSYQRIAFAVGLSKGAIAKYVSIAAAVGIKSWPLPDGVDEQAFERRLFPSTGTPPFAVHRTRLVCGSSGAKTQGCNLNAFMG